MKITDNTTTAMTHATKAIGTAFCFFVAAVCIMLSSCTKKMSTTDILVQDSVRHYYPLVQGTDLTLAWRVANVGSTPLVITDIQPSCGCIIEDGEIEKVVAPGKEIQLQFTFRSEKNNGYVKHTVRLYGNMSPQGMATLTFDLNVIAPALGSPDYEELYKNRSLYDEAKPRNIIIADKYRRDYWIKRSDYARGYNNKYWKEHEK
ncbi:MAG: DUF1573 domain-containing protein [Prevotella sp.]|nr:DUF1573 domain-containing protein [Candidatus Prevotella equi]